MYRTDPAIANFRPQADESDAHVGRAKLIGSDNRTTAQVELCKRADELTGVLTGSDAVLFEKIMSENNRFIHLTVGNAAWLGSKVEEYL